ncbi:MAG TPA: hypothetical protein VIK78_14670 [Ruminiclostridium sp.]
MKAVKVKISPTLLLQEIGLPGYYDVVDAKFDTFEQTLTLIITGYDLPEVVEGGVIPEGQIIVTKISKIEVV